jgi:hypothetical protein
MWSPQTPGQSSWTTPIPSLDLTELDDMCSSGIRSKVVDSILSSYGDISGDANKSTSHVREFKEDSLPSRIMSNSMFQAPATHGLKDHSYCLPTNLDDRTLSLQHDVQDLNQELAYDIGRETDTASISVTLSKLSQRTEMNGEIIKSIEARTVTTEELQKNHEKSSSRDARAILHVVQSIRHQLATDFPTVHTTLDQIQEAQAMVRDTQVMRMSDTPGSSLANDLSGLHAKLDDLLLGYNATLANNSSSEVRGLCTVTIIEFVEAFRQVKQILPLLEEIKNQASLQAQQQADSLRYLNELNTVGLFYSGLP